MDRPSYHDLHITTPDMHRTSIFNLPFNLIVQCTRTAGWEVWKGIDIILTGDKTKILLGGEYNISKPIRLDVAGMLICQTEGYVVEDIDANKLPQ